MKSFFVSVLALAGICCAQNLKQITLTAEDVEGREVFVIGDVHGCYDEMIELLTDEELLAEEDPTKIADHAIVIFAGDIINRGPLNHRVLQFVRGSGAYVVNGNHELNILDDPEKYEWTEEMSDEEWEWVREMPYVIRIPCLDSIVVHAGLIPNIELDEQTEFITTRMRNIEIEDDGTMIPHESRNDPGENWGIVYDGIFGHAVYGHDAGRGRDEDGNPIIQWNEDTTGLDSRCVYGGKLSGVYLPVTTSPNYSQVDCEEYARSQSFYE